MKKIFAWVTVIMLTFGLVACSSSPSEPSINLPEVTEDVIVTYDEFINKCEEEHVYSGLDYNKIFGLIKVEDEFWFQHNPSEKDTVNKDKTISGTTDEDKNLISLTIICEGVQVDWIQGKDAIEDFYERHREMDPFNMHGEELSAYNNTFDALKMVDFTYELISNQTNYNEAEIVILTSGQPVQVGKWSVSADVDPNASSVTIKAIYEQK